MWALRSHTLVSWAERKESVSKMAKFTDASYCTRNEIRSITIILTHKIPFHKIYPPPFLTVSQIKPILVAFIDDVSKYLTEVSKLGNVYLLITLINIAHNSPSFFLFVKSRIPVH